MRTVRTVRTVRWVQSVRVAPPERPCQAADVTSAACHITQTKPPQDASDIKSRTQRAMTVSLACSGNVLGCLFVLVKQAVVSGCAYR